MGLERWWWPAVHVILARRRQQVAIAALPALAVVARAGRAPLPAVVAVVVNRRVERQQIQGTHLVVPEDRARVEPRAVETQEVRHRGLRQ